MQYGQVFGERQDSFRESYINEPPIYCPECLSEACYEIWWDYKRPAGYITELLDKELLNCNELVGAAIEKLTGVITELFMIIRLNWLRDERGWKIKYLFEDGINAPDKEIYTLRSTRPGKSVEVLESGTNRQVTDFDGVALIEGSWTLAEAKTRSPFSTKKAMRQIELFQHSGVMGDGVDGPAYLLGVADNHRLKKRRSRAKFENKGGTVLFLRGVESQHIGMLASEYAHKLNLQASDIIRN